MADCTESKEETGPRPPVIMKFDAPEESSENSANDEVEGQSCEENSQTPPALSNKSAVKIHSPVLTASKFGNSFGVSEFKKSGFFGLNSTILRPSQFGTSSTTNPPSTSLTSFSSSNPFKKVNDNGTEIINDNKNSSKKTDDCDDDDDDDDNDNDNEKDPAKNNENKNEKIDDKCNKKSSDDKKPPTTTTPKFLPLVTNLKEHDNNLNNTVTSNSTVSGFVFGQNFKERATRANNVDNDDKNDELSKDSIDNNDDNNEEHDSNIIKNNDNGGSSELMFTTAATTACRTTTRPGITLNQAAQEMEEANRANKRKYSQVTLLTGEEDENNIIQINCKLFAFDKTTSGWKERGRGTIRLNDREDESRLVGRATGTQRLILNTQVWPGMTAERAGPKSLRLTAMDVHGDIRIFIVQAAPKEVDELHDSLLQRIKRAKERQPKRLATDV